MFVLLNTIAAGQTISEFPATVAPAGPMLVGPDGNMYFAGGRVTTDGTATSFGPPPQDCGASPLGFPAQGTITDNLAFDGNGNLWFTMPCGSNQFPPYPPLVRSLYGSLGLGGVRTIDVNSVGDMIGLPDGGVWISSGGIGKLNADLTISWAANPSGLTTGKLAVGPDGNLWFIAASGDGPILGAIISGTLTVVAQLPKGSNPGYLTLGPDGNFWITGSTSSPPVTFWVARCTPSGGFTEFDLAPQTVGVGRITSGPDGNVWFTEPGSSLQPGDKIGRVTPDGTITEFSTPSPNSMPNGIVAGPDGNIWFTEPGAGKVARINLIQNGSCITSETTLCLAGRFSVEAQWLRPGDQEPSAGHAVRITSNTGYFWFFDSTNIEMVVKVLNGCPENGHYWVFAGGLTNVAVEWKVTDQTTATVKPYSNPVGTPFQPVQDTTAFSCP